MRIHTVVERAGRSLSTLSARMEQDGNADRARARGLLGSLERPPRSRDLEMPDVGPTGADAASRARCSKLGAPPFTRHLVLQPRLGGLPFAGAQQPMEIGGWLGLAEPRPIDALSLAFFSDALFPPPFMRLTEPATAPTVDLTIHFRTAMPRPAEPDPDELCLARFRSGLVHEGFFEEDGVIWAGDGTVLAQSRQLAILMPLATG